MLNLVVSVEECGGEFRGVLFEGLEVFGYTAWYGSWVEAWDAGKVKLRQLELRQLELRGL